MGRRFIGTSILINKETFSGISTERFIISLNNAVCLCVDCAVRAIIMNRNILKQGIIYVERSMANLGHFNSLHSSSALLL